jgi:hypothetical protein
MRLHLRAASGWRRYGHIWLTAGPSQRAAGVCTAGHPACYSTVAVAMCGRRSRISPVSATSTPMAAMITVTAIAVW